MPCITREIALTVCDADGYDIKDVLALLDDITPACDAEMERRIEAAAQDRAAEDVMAQVYDAADLRRDERRMGA